MGLRDLRDAQGGEPVQRDVRVVDWERLAVDDDDDEATGF